MEMLKKFTFAVLALLLLVLLGSAATPTAAQDNQPYVCRDPRVEWIRLEFHNLPTLPKGVSWTSLADGGTFYDNVYVADALIDYPYNEDGITAGMVILGTTDYTFELRGDADSPACDVALSPIQDDANVPPESTPAPAPAAALCSYQAWDSVRGTYYCYTPLAGGIVPIPSAAAS